MFTVANGIVLRGLDLIPSKLNIVVDDGYIVDMSPDVCEGKVIDAEGCVVCPTFFNGHTHIGDSFIKDEGYSLSLSDLVKPPNGIKHKALSIVDDDEIISAMKSTMWDMVNNGITHFIDYREGGVKGVKLLKKASEDIPISPIILGRDDSFYGEDPDLSKVKIAIRKLLKVSDGIAPSGFGEITDDVAFLIASECKRKGKFSSIHVAESESNQIESLSKFSKSEIQRGIDCNFNQLVHCTNSMGDDLLSLAKSNVGVVVCPRSNATLNSGFVNLNKMVDLGIKPILGTDNVMINSPSMLRELEFTLKVMSLVHGNYLNPRDILKMATVNPCYFNFHRGFIEISHPAQFIVLNKFSKNPYLSIINRCEAKDILYMINRYYTNNIF